MNNSIIIIIIIIIDIKIYISLNYKFIYSKLPLILIFKKENYYTTFIE